MKPTTEDLKNRFDYHAPKQHQPEQYAHIRCRLREIAGDITALCPDCRELSTALTKLEEAMFWANAAIARHGE